jgi:hypothetical protein
MREGGGAMAHVVYMPLGRNENAAAQGRVRSGDLSDWMFSAQLFILVFLQKLVLPLGSGLPISLPLVTLYGWLAYMVVSSRLHVSGVRLAFAGLLFAAATVSQILASRPSSLLSFVQFLLLYLPFVLNWRVTGDKYLRLMGAFQNFMLVGAAMVFVQLAWQAAFGLGNQPNLEDFVPKNFLLHGYNYEAPIAWGHKFVRPNGFFFLEPSFASSFLATALVIELMFFRRVGRILLYGAAMLGTVAATGFVVALVGGPLALLARRDGRAAFAAAVAGIVFVVAAYWTGVLGLLLGRVSELGSPGSSGWERLIAPTIQLRSVYNDSTNIFVGVGAGNSVETNVSLWPLVKVVVEYGAFAGLLFVLFLTASMGRSVNRALAIALFIAFNFTGGFLLMPVTVIQILFLVSMLKLAPSPEAQQAGMSPGPAPRPVLIVPRQPYKG